MRPQPGGEEGGGGKGDKKGGKKDDKKKEGKGKGKGKGKGDKGGGDDEEQKDDACSELFSKQVEGAVHDYSNLWRNREDAGDITQRHDANLVRESLRPLIFEEARPPSLMPSPRPKRQLRQPGGAAPPRSPASPIAPGDERRLSGARTFPPPLASPRRSAWRWTRS